MLLLFEIVIHRSRLVIVKFKM